MNEPFTITLTSRKLLKSSAVRKWLREVEKVLKSKKEEGATAWWME